MNINTLLVYICIHFHSAATNHSTVQHQLYQELFIAQEYNSKIQPILNDGNGTVVSMGMYLKTINSLDAVSETLQTSAYLDISWTDAFLSWNSSDYNGVYFAVWPQDDVWKPDVILYNSIQAYRPLGHKTMMVENFDNGKIIWWPMELFETSCAVDMTYFPFDIQTCEIQFIPWSYADVILIGKRDTISLSYYSKNALWDILDTNVEITDVNNVYLISFKLKLQRKPQFHIFTLFLPVLLLATLNIFSHVLPINGDRTGYAVTVFLAFSVFLTIAENVMPPNSEKMSLFSVYLLIQTSQSALTTILAVVLTRAESMSDNTKIPHFLVFLERLSRGVCKKKTTAKISPHAKETKLQEMDDHADDDGRLSRVEGTKEVEPCTWMMVVAAVDKIGFILFSVVFVLTTTVLFCIMYLRPN